MDLGSFSDSYVELLNSSEADNRRIIVYGLLPRQSVDLKPYNEILKAICEENDSQYIDHYNSFLLASTPGKCQNHTFTKTNCTSGFLVQRN